MSDETAVVTCFLRNRGDVLLFRRASDASTYPGKWGAVSGYLEHDDPLRTARMEIREETGITDFDLARTGDPFEVRDGGVEHEWTVHPFLFDAGTREVRLNGETAEAEWTSPTRLLRRETVPGLWTSYDRVRPRPETITADDEHGSAYLSIRALEVLRDEAALASEQGKGIDAVRKTGEEVLAARPSMAALRNRVNRVIVDANTPEAVERWAIEGIGRALTADDEAAANAAEVIQGETVLTLSRSGTVSNALLAAEPTVVIAESRPACEGIEVAEELARDGLDVTVCTDAAIAHVLAESDVDALLVGADTILADGRVVNKTGTRSAAIAADREEVSVYVVAAADKITHRREPALESGPPEAVYDGDADLDILNPTFDVTPADCVDGIVTERGVLDPADVHDVAEAHRERAGWSDR